MGELLKHYRTMADTGKHFRGLSMVQHADQIGRLVRDTGSRTLLDWGAGAGDAYRLPHRVHEQWGVQMPVRFDPAFPKFSRVVRGKFDGVLCCDVLEHIPEADVPGVVAQLVGHARRFVFASVCCRPAAKTFPDGRNLHVTLQPLAWWQDQFTPHLADRPGLVLQLVETP